MQTTRSASFAGTLSRSAAEVASTVSIPSLRQVRMMRAAISPRLAIRIRRIAIAQPSLADAQQGLAVLDEGSVSGKDLGDLTANAGPYRVHQLHDFDDGDDRVLLDRRA